jgi:predicted RNA methylase
MEEQLQVQREAERSGHDPWEHDQYFGSYESLMLQKAMLSDKRRNEAYKSAIEATVKDKVVLDAGCGTGYLSFCAQRAGALRVYGVEGEAL